MSESNAEAVVPAVASATEAATEVAAGGRRRATGIAGVAIGVVARGGAAAGVAIERLTVGRGMRQKARLALDSAGPYGGLRGNPGKAYADDGTELYYEVDDVEPEAESRAHPAQAAAVRPQGARPRDRRLQPRLLPQPGLLALPAGRPCGASSAPCTGTSAATAVPGGACPRCGTVGRSPSTSWAAT
ncbi:hypothetical protein LV779_22785 [Streptomyces thinghirensis]|nr:hypothetical protein [Streptomyces thinghirensis]